MVVTHRDDAARSGTARAALRNLAGSADLVALVVMLGFGLAYFLLALRLPAGNLSAASSGTFPRIVGVLVIVSAGTSLIIRLVWHRVAGRELDEDEEPGEREFGDAFWRVPALTACLVLYIALAPRLGHILGSSVASFLILLMLGQRPRWQMAVLSIGFGVASFALFRSLLEVPLPTGSWFP